MSDDGLRLLERRVAAGDDEARLRLHEERVRRGLLSPLAISLHLLGERVRRGELTEHAGHVLGLLKGVAADRGQRWSREVEPNSLPHRSSHRGNVVQIGGPGSKRPRRLALVVGSGPKGQNRFVATEDGELTTAGSQIAFAIFDPQPAARRLAPESLPVQWAAVKVDVPKEWLGEAARLRACQREQWRQEAQRRRTEILTQGELFVREVADSEGSKAWEVFDRGGPSTPPRSALPGWRFLTREEAERRGMEIAHQRSRGLR